MVFKAIQNSVHSWVNAEKTNPLKWLDNMGHTTVDATIVNTTDYVADVLDSWWQTLQSTWALINPWSYGKHWLKNLNHIPQAVVNFAWTFKNLFFGLNSWLNNLYKKWVLANVRHTENATLEHIPVAWSAISKTLNTILSVPALLPAAIDGLAGVFDKGQNWVNSKTELEWQNLPKTRMRIKKDGSAEIEA